MASSTKNTRAAIRIGPEWQAVIPDAPCPVPAASSSSSSSAAAAAAAAGDTDADTGSDSRNNAASSLTNTSAVAVPAPVSGEPLWLASEHKSSRSLTRFMHSIRALFDDGGTAAHYCQRRALYLLHQCDYDTECALGLARPWTQHNKRVAQFAQSAAVRELLEANLGDAQFEGDDKCFLCHDGGDLVLCEVPSCGRVFHPACVLLERVPTGSFICSYHKCITCKQSPTSRRWWCVGCPLAYCDKCVPDVCRREVLGMDLMEFLCAGCIQREKRTNPAIRKGGKRWFMRRVLQLLKRQGTPLKAFPVVNGQQLDLCVLFKEVLRRGGLAMVSQKVGWRHIQLALRVPDQPPENVGDEAAVGISADGPLAVGEQIETAYRTILLPYEKRQYEYYRNPDEDVGSDATAAVIQARAVDSLLGQWFHSEHEPETKWMKQLATIPSHEWDMRPDGVPTAASLPALSSEDGAGGAGGGAGASSSSGDDSMAEPMEQQLQNHGRGTKRPAAALDSAANDAQAVSATDATSSELAPESNGAQKGKNGPASPNQSRKRQRSRGPKAKKESSPSRRKGRKS